MPDTEMLESINNENERDRTHLTSKLTDRVTLSAGTLAKYAGTSGDRKNFAACGAITQERRPA
jgi:hypothetical protein